MPARPRSPTPAAHLPRAAGGWVQREEPIMGLLVRVELWCEPRSRGVAAAAAVLDEMHRIDRRLNPQQAGSALRRIQQGQPAPDDALAAHAVDRCLELLRERGITQARVSAGRVTRVLGDGRVPGAVRRWGGS